jgi:hypothetical protein
MMWLLACGSLPAGLIPDPATSVTPPASTLATPTRRPTTRPAITPLGVPVSPLKTPTATTPPTDTPPPWLRATIEAIVKSYLSPIGTPACAPCLLTPTPAITRTALPGHVSPLPTPRPGGGSPLATPKVVTGTQPGAPFNITDQIKLLDPADNVRMLPEPGQLEFKWVWVGHGCAAPPQGQGFEVRIWPNQAGFGPMGVMDAKQQGAIRCEAKTGTRTFEVGNLRGAPGVIAGGGGGLFRWDVALVRLDPYAPQMAAASRVFELPTGPATPTPTPGPTRVPKPASQDWGDISLLQPDDNFALASGIKKLEFHWRWSLSKECARPPAGYGFELRIWPERPDEGPMGAMGDARYAQDAIFCDSGHFGYLVNTLGTTPGVLKTGAGRFRWDVVLVQLEPYTILVTSGSRAFELPGAVRQ